MKKNIPDTWMQFMAEVTWSEFDDFGMLNEVRTIWWTGWSGTLRARIGEYARSVYFVDGTVFFAASNDPEDKLSRILIASGHFTQTQYDSVLPGFKRDWSVGKNLAEVGLITPGELRVWVRAQILQIFYGTLRAKSGFFSLTEDSPKGLPRLMLRFPVDFIGAIMGINDKAWIANRFGPDLDFYCRPRKSLTYDSEIWDLAGLGQDVFELLREKPHFNRLAMEGSSDEFTLLKFLFSLLLLGYLEISREEPEPERPLAEIEEDTRPVRPEMEKFQPILPPGEPMGEFELPRETEPEHWAPNPVRDDDPVKKSRSFRSKWLFLFVILAGALIAAVLYFKFWPISETVKAPDNTVVTIPETEHDPETDASPTLSENPNPDTRESLAEPAAEFEGKTEAPGEDVSQTGETVTEDLPDNPPEMETAPGQTRRPVETDPQPEASSSRKGTAPYDLALRGDYAEAARVWEAGLQDRQAAYTIALFMLCSPETLAKAASAARGHEAFMLLPKNFNGRPCYWVCWGSYANRMDALLEIEKLPAEYLEEREGIGVYLFQDILP